MTTIHMTTAERLTQGLGHQQAGRLDEAEECYLDVVTAEPNNTEALKLLAILAVMRGDYDDGLSYASAAVEQAPRNGDYWHLLGRIQLDVGEAEAALQSLKNALPNAPSDPLDLNLDLAAAHAQCGAVEESLAIATEQLQNYPDDLRTLHAAATAAAALERTEEALIYFERGIKIDPMESAMWAGAAKMRRALGDLANAWQCIERALSLAPDDSNLHFIARAIRTEAVPAWHFNMMNDVTRNTAFKKAIERQIKPHHLVLEIGTGAGLLAMMASRTGAKIMTCESNSALAMTAAGLIQQNGLSDRITVLDKPSWEIEAGRDLPQKADVLISEIFSAQFLSEEVIPTLEDAKRRLLKPGGIVIPSGGSLVGALVMSDDLATLTRVGTVEGFDFSSFNAFTPLIMNLDTPNYALKWLSDPIDLFTFDFLNNDTFPAESINVALEVTEDGLCQGVVQWLRLMLDSETPYENKPLGVNAISTKHWTPLFYPLPVPRELKKGQTVMLQVAHDRKGVRVELMSID